MQEAYLALGGSARRSTPNEYAQLKQLVKQRGLLDQQPAYYTWKFLFTLGLLVIGIAFLFIMHNVWDHMLSLTARPVCCNLIRTFYASSTR